MDFNKYDLYTTLTHKEFQFVYSTLAISMQSGKLCQALQAFLFGNREFTIEEITQLLTQLFWYGIILCVSFDINFEQILRQNLAKLDEFSEKEEVDPTIKEDGN